MTFEEIKLFIEVGAMIATAATTIAILKGDVRGLGRRMHFVETKVDIIQTMMLQQARFDERLISLATRVDELAHGRGFVAQAT